MTHPHRAEVVLSEDSKLTLSNLPFHAGDAVEVIIFPRSRQGNGANRYPLRGQPLHYEQPTEPVALEDWEALQ